MPETLTGFFKTRSEGEAAQAALVSNGFTREEVGFLVGATEPHETPAIGPVLHQAGSQSEIAEDTWYGAAVGLAAGLVAILPDVGPLVAVGPLAGIVGGLAIGGAVGSFVGLLKDRGISEEEADFYAQGVRDGGSLVTVHHVSGERAGEARRILAQHGVIQTEGLIEDSAEQGQAVQSMSSHNTCGEDIP